MIASILFLNLFSQKIAKSDNFLFGSYRFLSIRKLKIKFHLDILLLLVPAEASASTIAVKVHPTSIFQLNPFIARHFT